MKDIAKIGANNIQRVHFDKFEKDFSFIVNGEVYQTNSYVASILSPNISKLFDENINISCYELNPKYQGDFNRIIEYGEMKPVHIKKGENQYFRNIMQLLGNNEEFLRFSQELQEEISFENVIERIQIKKGLDLNFDEEITFISSNFHIFYTKYPETILTLDLDIIEQIISNKRLKLLDEEELFDIVLQLYIRSKEYSLLFSYIIFLNLSTESIRKFNQNFNINDINGSIWANIRCRLEQNISTKSIKIYKKMNQEFLNNRYTVRRYEHIIQHLSEKCNDNAHTQNIVQITASSMITDYLKVENIVEQNNNFFGTKDEANSWIQFDFKEKKVLLDRYSLKTFNGSENDAHLKSWILEVSNDGENYKEIDRHENDDILNGRLKTATFKVSCLTPQRFVRLRQIGSNWYGSNCLLINQVEFSGFLYE